MAKPSISLGSSLLRHSWHTNTSCQPVSTVSQPNEGRAKGERNSRYRAGIFRQLTAQPQYTLITIKIGHHSIVLMYWSQNGKTFETIRTSENGKYSLTSFRKLFQNAFPLRFLLENKVSEFASASRKIGHPFLIAPTHVGNTFQDFLHMGL